MRGSLSVDGEAELDYKYRPYVSFYNESEDVSGSGYIVSPEVIIWQGGDWRLAETGTANELPLSFSNFSQPVYAEGDKVIWGGYVWEKLSTDNYNAPNNPNEMPSDWRKIPYNTTDYNQVLDTVYVGVDNNEFLGREDNAGNVIKFSNEYINSNGDGILENFQWGRPYIVYDNRIFNSYCECINFDGQRFSGNTLNSHSQIRENLILNSNIHNNELSNGEISYNFLDDDSYISDNVVSGDSSIEDNTLLNSYINRVNVLSRSSLENSYLLDASMSRSTIADDSNIYEVVLDDCYIRRCTIKEGGGLNGIRLFQDLTNLSISAAILYTDFNEAGSIYSTHTRQIIETNDNKICLVSYSTTGVVVEELYPDDPM